MEKSVENIARSFGRVAFGDDPARYHRVRPAYPNWVFDVLSSQCGLRPNAAVFEIGAGTGTATQQLLKFGVDPLVAIEPDQRLADFLSANNPDAALTLVVAPFEEAGLGDARFDLGFSATAFHWLDEDAALAKIARLLRPGGWWAAVWNEFGDDRRPDPFHEATKELLAGPTSPSAGNKGVTFAMDVDARLSALNRSSAFDRVEHQASQWTLVLDAAQTTDLYSTYSNVNARSDRKAVLAQLGRIARDQFQGKVVRNMVTSLYIARRRADM
jgi:SAM-dependent methyltransferase